MARTRSPRSTDVAGDEGTPVRRPDPLRWLWYAYGGSLPARFAPWVLHDTTCRTWAVRHVLRIVTQIAPFAAAIIIFVPGPLWLRMMCALGGAIMGMIFAVAYIHETAEHRLVKAGYPPGTGVATRGERTREKDEARAARYAARWRNGPVPEQAPHRDR